MSKLKHKEIWSGIHRGIPFEVHRRNTLDNVAWTFYAFIHESKAIDFALIWLDPKLDGEWVNYAYFQIPVGDGWNGGLTYYRKHGEIEGHRCVEIGCDYMHLWDDGREYTVSYIEHDARRSIDGLCELVKLEAVAK